MAAILFMPPAVIGGICGMNVKIPFMWVEPGEPLMDNCYYDAEL